MMHDDDDRIADIERQLDGVAAEVEMLKRKQAMLKRRRDELLRERDNKLKRELELAEPDWTSATSFPWSTRLTEIATQKFSFSELRTEQLQAMNASMSGYDVLAVMKTGGGKSLCYQLPALVRECGFSIIVCPLIALVRDQVLFTTVYGFSAHDVLLMNRFGVCVIYAPRVSSA